MKSSKSPDANVMINRFPPSGVPMYDGPTKDERIVARRKPAVPTEMESLRIVLAAAPAVSRSFLAMLREIYRVADAGRPSCVNATKRSEERRVGKECRS